jgi:hypothetical protein
MTGVLCLLCWCRCALPSAEHRARHSVTWLTTATGEAATATWFKFTTSVLNSMPQCTHARQLSVRVVDVCNCTARKAARQVAVLSCISSCKPLLQAHQPPASSLLEQFGTVLR